MSRNESNSRNGNTGTDVAVIQPPRLPFDSRITERFPSIDKTAWKALVEAVFPTAKSNDSVILALAYCHARKLDVFKRPVHIVPMWSSAKGEYVETIWPGIGELRTTAFRTGNYAGSDEAVFGPLITERFTGEVKKWGKRGQPDTFEQKTIEVTFPEWCQVTVYRVLGDRVCRFVGPKVYWLETYAKSGKTDLPNDMWQKRANGQLEKCAEAAALRKAFPEEIGNDLTADEMEGQTIDHEYRVAAAPTLSPPSPPSPTAGPPSPPTIDHDDAPDDFDRSAFFESLELAMAGAKDRDEVWEAWNDLDVEATLSDHDDEDGSDLGLAVKIRHRRLNELKTSQADNPLDGG